MYTKNISRVFSIVSVFMVLAFAHVVFASTPTFTVSASGDGDSVLVNVSGDANQSVLLSYYKANVGQQLVSIGTTNSNGIFSATISSAQYGIASNTIVHVLLGGINGSSSPNVTWPVVSGYVNGNLLSLSQTGVVVTIGQTTTLSANNVGTGILYLSSNSNPLIANVSISGTQITVSGNSYGSTTATVCLVNNTSNCASMYIIVQNSGAQPLSFSQSSVSLSSGQSITIQITGGSGNYSVVNNSSQSPNLVQTNISGSTVVLTTTGTTGSSSLTLCSTDMASCGIINVAIGPTASTQAISFSQSAPTVVIGQSLSVSIYGPANTLFYVSSNSSPNLVQVNLSGNTLSLLGIASGSSTLSICASTNNCGTLTVTVNANSNGGKLTLSQDTVSVLVGQTQTITVSGGSLPYTISSSGTTVQATLNNNIITLLGLSVGSTVINVCSTAGSCLSLSVSVQTPNTVSALPSGCTTVYGYSTTTGQACSPTTATVTTTPSTQAVSPSRYVFSKTLGLGSKGVEVKELQQKLKTLGFYAGPINSSFGPLTQKAVKALQKAHKLPIVGITGPKTRVVLNK